MRATEFVYSTLLSWPLSQVKDLQQTFEISMKTGCTAPEGNSGLFNVFDHLVWINKHIISHARKGFGN